MANSESDGTFPLPLSADKTEEALQGWNVLSDSLLATSFTLRSSESHNNIAHFSVMCSPLCTPCKGSLIHWLTDLSMGMGAFLCIRMYLHAARHHDCPRLNKVPIFNEIPFHGVICTELWLCCVYLWLEKVLGFCVANPGAQAHSIYSHFRVMIMYWA